MIKRKKYGQHFLSSQTIAKQIVSEAKIKKNDNVLEIGTGKGILIPYLCQNAKKVVSIESDKQLYDFTKSKFSEIDNLEIKHADGFKSKEKFSIFVSNLPYSQSRKAMEWLMQKKYSFAVIMVQKEFAEKLLSTGKERSAISILANYSAKIESVLNVNKNNFRPKPKIDSVVLKLTRKKSVQKELIQTVNTLFSFRRKKLGKILKKFNLDMNLEQRIDELSGDEIIKIAKKIIRESI